MAKNYSITTGWAEWAARSVARWVEEGSAPNDAWEYLFRGSDDWRMEGIMRHDSRCKCGGNAEEALAEFLGRLPPVAVEAFHEVAKRRFP